MSRILGTLFLLATFLLATAAEGPKCSFAGVIVDGPHEVELKEIGYPLAAYFEGARKPWRMNISLANNSAGYVCKKCGYGKMVTASWYENEASESMMILENGGFHMHRGYSNILTTAICKKK